MYARRIICEDIFGSGMFFGFAINRNEMYKELSQPRHVDLFRRIYSLTEKPFKRLLRLYEYTNAYSFQKLEAPNTSADRHLSFYSVGEYVFICPVRGKNSNDITFYYVSKEYNVLNAGEYTAGRFIFGSDKALPKLEIMKLAEEPARIYVEENFNIEHHYLEIRSRHQPGKTRLVVTPSTHFQTQFTLTNFWALFY